METLIQQYLAGRDLDAITVGLLASRDFFSVRLSSTVGEVKITHSDFRAKRQNGDTTYLYVTCDEGKFKGVLSMDAFCWATDEVRIEDIYLPEEKKALKSKATLEVALALFTATGLTKLPVVSEDGVLLGVFAENVLGITDGIRDLIHHQEVINLETEVEHLEEEIDALTPFASEAMKKASVRKATLLRSAPLSATFVSGIACAIALHFDKTVAVKIPEALIFIPLLLQLADAVCHQSTCVAITEYISEIVDRLTFKKLLFRESLVYGNIGLLSGAIVGILALISTQSVYAASGIGLSACISAASGGFVGFFIPGIVKFFKGNPDSSAGPISLALADFSTTLIFLLVLGSIFA
jgi:Mg/Co/Ni transporter MgtE